MKKIDFRGREIIASFMAEMAENSCHELHKLASLFIEAEISAIKITRESVEIYFSGEGDSIFVSAENNDQIRKLFGDECIIRSEHFWATMGEIWGQYESTHVKATRELWEEWCRVINPFIHNAIPDEKKQAA